MLLYALRATESKACSVRYLTWLERIEQADGSRFPWCRVAVATEGVSIVAGPGAYGQC